MQVINKLILGTVQFGLNYGINNSSGKPSQPAVDEIFSAAYSSGVRYLDTAEAYGTSHEVIGQFHQANPGQIFNVITKFPHQIDESVDIKIEKYLEELKVPSLHGLLFHSYQTYEDNKSSIALLNNYKLNNKVKYIGVSVYTNAQIEKVIEDEYIDIVQLPFNLFDNANLREDVLNKLKEKGKQIHTRSAFLQGLFFLPETSDHKIAKSLAPELKYIRNLSNETGVAIQKMALNYCLQQPNIDYVLIGVDNVHQLKQNLNYAKEPIADALIESINDIRIKNIDLLNPSLWNQ